MSRASIAIIAAALLLGGCGADPTIRGKIDDAQIRLEQSSATGNVWLELTNVGAEPCDLVAFHSNPPSDSLPVVDQVVVTQNGPMEAYMEVNGEPTGQTGVATVIAPGEVARMQLAFTGSPQGEAVIVCNGPGEYEAGRYGVLAYSD